MKDHRLIDERSLALHRLVAAKLVADPSLVDHARRNIKCWLLTCSPRLRPALLEWQILLEQPAEQLYARLLATDEHAVELRQSSPFAGLLTTAERTLILREFQQRDQIPA